MHGDKTNQSEVKVTQLPRQGPVETELEKIQRTQSTGGCYDSNRPMPNAAGGIVDPAEPAE